jgi:hypothetical protein
LQFEIQSPVPHSAGVNPHIPLLLQQAEFAQGVPKNCYYTMEKHDDGGSRTRGTCPFGKVTPDQSNTWMGFCEIILFQK